MKDIMTFPVGCPRIIHYMLIAVLADLQNMVIYSTKGEVIGRINEHKKHIDFAKGFDIHLRVLQLDSSISDLISGYTVSFFEINGNASTRKWDVKITFTDQLN